VDIAIALLKVEQHQEAVFPEIKTAIVGRESAYRLLKCCPPFNIK